MTRKRPARLGSSEKRGDRPARIPVARKAKPPRRTEDVSPTPAEDRLPGAVVDALALKRVAFTLFPVVDSARARDFYERVLGLKRGLASPDGVWTEYDLPLGGCLALFKHPMPDLAMKPGGASVAFEVRDLDDLNAKLKAAGVKFRGDVVHGPRCRMSNIQDTEGNHIILHQLNPR